MNSPIKFILRIILLLLASCFGGYSLCQAQEADTTIGMQEPRQRQVVDPHTHFIFSDLMELSPDSMQYIDTSLKDLQHYDPLLHRKNHYTGLGTNASPSVPLFLTLPVESGFLFGFNQWDLYTLRRNNMPFYNTRTPYTDLRYSTGPVELRHLRVIHSQNILPNWNASLQFRKISNDGNYPNQLSDVNNVGLNTWYRSASRRYMVAASAIWNHFDFHENGGIQSDTFLESTYLTPSQKTNSPVKVNRTNRQFMDQQFQDQNYMLKQFYYLGRKEQKKFNDTTDLEILHPSFFISHTFNYQTQRYTYRDSFPDTTLFYKDFFFDSVSVKERHRNKIISNTLSIGNIAQKSSVTSSESDTSNVTDSLGITPILGLRNDLGYMVFAKHDYIRVQQPYIQDTTFQNITLGAQIIFPGRFGFNLRGEYIPYGYNQGDYFLKGSAEAPLPLPKEIADKLKIEATVQQFEPAFIQQRMFNNHFIWENDFNKTQAYTLSAGLTAPFEVGVKAQYSVVNNLVYYNQEAKPQQADQTLQYMSFTFDKDIRIWHFHLNNSLVYQKILQGDFVRFPDVSYRGSFYFEAQRIFKIPMGFQIGVDGRYTSAYTAYAYMPGISQFHLQDNVVIGNYPFIDAFLNVKVKRFSGFIKLEHINRGLNGFRYYTTPHYPFYPTFLRFGIRWMFYT